MSTCAGPQTGQIATPAFGTVVAVARVLTLWLDDLAETCLAGVDLEHTG